MGSEKGKRRLPGEGYHSTLQVDATSWGGTEFSEHASLRGLNHHRACSRLEGVGQRDGVDLDQGCLVDGNLTCHVRHDETRVCVDARQSAQPGC